MCRLHLVAREVARGMCVAETPVNGIGDGSFRSWVFVGAPPQFACVTARAAFDMLGGLRAIR